MPDIKEMISDFQKMDKTNQDRVLATNPRIAEMMNDFNQMNKSEQEKVLTIQPISSQPKQKKQGYSALPSDLSEIGADIETAAKKVYSGEMPIDRGLLRGAGAIAKFPQAVLGRTVEEVIPQTIRTELGKIAGTIANEGLSLIPGAEDALSQGLEKIAGLYNRLSKKHPESAQDLKDLFNIVSILPWGKAPFGVKAAAEVGAEKVPGRILTDEETEAYIKQKAEQDARQAKEAEKKTTEETKKTAEGMGFQIINPTLENVVGKLAGAAHVFNEVERNNFRKIASQYYNMVEANISPEKLNQFEERTKNMLSAQLKSRGITNNESLNAMKDAVGDAFGVIRNSNIPGRTVAEELGMDLQAKIIDRSKTAGKNTEAAYADVGELLTQKGIKIVSDEPVMNTAKELYEEYKNNPAAKGEQFLGYLEKIISAEGRDISRVQEIAQNIRNQIGVNSDSYPFLNGITASKNPDEVKKIFSEMSKTKNIPPDIINLLKPEVEKLAPNGRTWKELSDMATIFRQKVEETAVLPGISVPGAKSGESIPRQVYSKLVASIREAQDVAAEKAGIGEKLAKAKNLHKLEKNIYRNPTVLKALTADPEAFFNNPNLSTDLSQIKDTLNEKDFNKYYKPYITHFLLTRGQTISEEGTRDIFNPKAVMDRLTKIGTENLSKIYSYNELNTIKKAAFKGIEFTKTTIEGEEQKSLEKLLKITSPDTILNALFKEDNNVVYKNLEVMDNLLKASGDKKGREVLKNRLIKEIFTKEQSLNLEGKLRTFSGAKMESQLTTYNEALKKLVPEAQYKLINDITKSAMEMRGGADIGGKHVKFSYWYLLHSVSSMGIGMAGLFTGHLAPMITGGAFLTVPYVVAKLYTWQGGRALMREGLKKVETAGEFVDWTKRVAEKLPPEGKAALLKSLAAYEVQNQQNQQETNQ